MCDFFFCYGSSYCNLKVPGNSFVLALSFSTFFPDIHTCILELWDNLI